MVVLVRCVSKKRERERYLDILKQEECVSVLLVVRGPSDKDEKKIREKGKREHDVVVQRIRSSPA